MSATRETLDYRDLEGKLHDAVNMSEVACDMIEQIVKNGESCHDKALSGKGGKP